MGEINFLANDEEELKKAKNRNDKPVVKWTNPGVFRVANKNKNEGVEDIFADTEKTRSKSYNQENDVAEDFSVPDSGKRTNILNLFAMVKEAFLGGKNKASNSGQFKKNKEQLREYHQALQTEGEARRNNVIEVAKEDRQKKPKVSSKSYFRRDQWQAPNVIKTNLIQDEKNSSLDWSQNINMLMTGVASACLIVALGYLGLQLKESFSVQKSQQTSQDIQNIKMQIIAAKKDLGDIDTFQKKLEVASTLLEKHIYWTNFFKFWEDNLLKEVYFNNDFGGSVNGEYTFSAVTDSYSNAANQIRLLREAGATGAGSLIKELVVNQAQYTEGEMNADKKTSDNIVTFELKVKMDQNIFYKKD